MQSVGLAGCGKKEFPPPAPSLLSLPEGEKLRKAAFFYPGCGTQPKTVGRAAVPAMAASEPQVASTTAGMAGTAARPTVKQLPKNMKLLRRITQHI